MRRIEPAELHEQMQRGEVQVLDVRGDGPFRRATAHIPGDVHQSPGYVEQWSAQIPEGAHLVLYCTCPGEATSARVAGFLESKGYCADTLAGGLEAWMAQGYPAEPLTRQADAAQPESWSCPISTEPAPRG